MERKKQILAIAGVVCIISASFVLLVYAAAWDPQDMANYMYNVGRHKIYQTNWILYNEIGPKVDDIKTDISNLDMDVSGWLHTTQSGYSFEVRAPTSGWTKLLEIKTKGYKQLTIGIRVYDARCMFKFQWHIDPNPPNPHPLVYEGEWDLPANNKALPSYDIIGEDFTLWVQSMGTIEARVYAAYYMTT